jgi:hypothetical protein
MGSRSETLYRFALLACAGVVAACSQAPTEPAPVFTLPAHKVIDGPKMEGQAAPPPLGQAATPQLQYVAVPAGRKISGMAQARVIVKQAKVKPHRSGHARKAKSVAQRHQPKVAAKPSTSDAGRDEVKRVGEAKSE